MHSLIPEISERVSNPVMRYSIIQLRIWHHTCIAEHRKRFFSSERTPKSTHYRKEDTWKSSPLLELRIFYAHHFQISVSYNNNSHTNTEYNFSNSRGGVRAENVLFTSFRNKKEARDSLEVLQSCFVAPQNSTGDMRIDFFGGKVAVQRRSAAK